MIPEKPNASFWRACGSRTPEVLAIAAPSTKGRPKERSGLDGVSPYRKSLNSIAVSFDRHFFLVLIALLRGESEKRSLQRAGRATLLTQFVARADSDQPPLMNDPDSIGHFFGDAELMSGNENSHSLKGTFFENVLDDTDMLRVEPDHWFVDDKHFRIVQQGRSDGDSLASSMGKALDWLVEVGSQIQAGNQCLSRSFDSLRRHLKELTGKAEKFPRGQLIVEKRKIRHVSEAFARLQRLSLHVVTRHPSAAGSGFEQAGHEFDRRGFAGSVGAEHSEKFPAGNDQTEIVDRHQIAEAFDQMNQFNHAKRSFSEIQRLVHEHDLVREFHPQYLSYPADKDDRAVAVEQPGFQPVDPHG
jgi:hypothetical protein